MFEGLSPAQPFMLRGFGAGRRKWPASADEPNPYEGADPDTILEALEAIDRKDRVCSIVTE